MALRTWITFSITRCFCPVNGSAKSTRTRTVTASAPSVWPKEPAEHPDNSRRGSQLDESARFGGIALSTAARPVPYKSAVVKKYTDFTADTPLIDQTAFRQLHHLHFRSVQNFLPKPAGILVETGFLSRPDSALPSLSLGLAIQGET